METLISFLLASAVTLFFVRRYMKKLTASRPASERAGGQASSSAPQKMQPCPRCGKPIAANVAFCSFCGAPLAMWTVHRAAIKAAGAGGDKGKPKPVINASLCIGCGSCVEVCPETGTLELVNGKAILNHPDRCTGHAKCAEVCPTQAIVLSFGGVLQTLKVPLVKENFETNVPGIFIIGELAGMGLIKTAVNEGRLVVDHLNKVLAAQKQNSAPSAGASPAATPPAGGEPAAVADLLVVGTGPAGLSASLTAHQHGLNYITLEQGEIASTIRQYPRHKFLMAEPIEIPLYGHLYVGDGTKETLLSVWETIISNTGVRVRTNERVERVSKNGGNFLVETTKGRHHAKYVVLAMGRRGTPRRLGVPGEDLAKVTYQLIEADTYEDKDVLVVGGGDSAIEAVLGLAKRGRNRVTLSYRGERFQRARERNQKMLEAAEKEGKLRILRNSHLTEIRANSVKLDHAGAPVEIPNHYVFILIGGNSPEEFLRKTGIEIVEKSLSV